MKMSSPVEGVSASFIVISVILSTIVIGTIVGNVFVITAILIDKNLQTTANQLVLSLAVADLMVACLVMPLGAYNDIHQGWYLGKEVCEFWTSADVLCCTEIDNPAHYIADPSYRIASILNLLAIATDRYWAVTSVDYIYRRTRKRVNMMILCAWTVGAIVSLAPIFGWKDPDFAYRVLVEHKCLVSQDVAYQIFATISTFYAPLVLLLGLYWRIFQVARKRIRRKANLKGVATAAAQAQARTKNGKAAPEAICGQLAGASGTTATSSSGCPNSNMGELAGLEREVCTRTKVKQTKEDEVFVGTGKGSSSRGCHNGDNNGATIELATKTGTTYNGPAGSDNRRRSRGEPMETSGAPSLASSGSNLAHNNNKEQPAGKYGFRVGGSRKTSEGKRSWQEERSKKLRPADRIDDDKNNEPHETIGERFQAKLQEQARPDERNLASGCSLSSRVTTSSSTATTASTTTTANKRRIVPVETVQSLGNKTNGNGELAGHLLSQIGADLCCCCANTCPARKLCTTSSCSSSAAGSRPTAGEYRQSCKVVSANCASGSGEGDARVTCKELDKKLEINHRIGDSGQVAGRSAYLALGAQSGGEATDKNKDKERRGSSGERNLQEESWTTDDGHSLAGLHLSPAPVCLCRHWLPTEGQLEQASRKYPSKRIDFGLEEDSDSSASSLREDLRSREDSQQSDLSASLSGAFPLPLKGLGSPVNQTYELDRREQENEMRDGMSNAPRQTVAALLTPVSQATAQRGDKLRWPPSTSARRNHLNSVASAAVALTLIQQDNNKELAMSCSGQLGSSESGGGQAARTMRSLDIRRKFRALGQLVSFVQTSRSFNSFSSTPSTHSDDDDDNCGKEEESKRTTGLELGEEDNEAGVNEQTPARNPMSSELVELSCRMGEANETTGRLDIATVESLASSISRKEEHLASSGQPFALALAQAAGEVRDSTWPQGVANRKISPGCLRDTQTSGGGLTSGQQQQQQQQAKSRRENMDIKREKKAAKTLAIITGVFVCCWLPFFLNAIIMPICGQNCTPSDLILSILLWLGYLNSLLNPIIYTIFSPDFRRAFRRLLCWPPHFVANQTTTAPTTATRRSYRPKGANAIK